MCYSYDRSVKLNAVMEAKRRPSRKNFFICLRAKRANKNKINCDKKVDDFAGMKAFLYFS